MAETFKRVIENFECANCGTFVEGNGYTNHCPKCLFSMHVDINPGDRASGCKGIMEPVDIAPKQDHYVIIHLCRKCGHNQSVRTQDDDNISDFIESLGPRFPDF